LKIDGIPFANIVWAEQPRSEIPGEAGITISRTVQQGDLRVRVVEFSPGYLADHWCPKGHVVFVLEGTLTSDLDDGRSFTTSAGSCFVVGDNDGRHRARTDTGAKVFIVD
jgi:quercetin dioxygenase-like cupin family protein